MKQFNFTERKVNAKEWERKGDSNLFLFHVDNHANYEVRAYVSNINGKLEVFGCIHDIAAPDCEMLYSTSILEFLTVWKEHCCEKNDIMANREEYDNICDCLWQFADEESHPVVLEMTAADFSAMFDILAPGDYLVHIKEERKEELEIGQVLTLSTAHLDHEGILYFMEEHDEITVYEHGEHGLMVYVPEDFREDAVLLTGVPATLLKCMQLARDNNCIWLNLDRDGETVTLLPTYEW